MNINKYFKLKYILLVICLIVILLGFFYLYNYLYNKYSIEPFTINQWPSSSIQNYYKGEPLINTVNHPGTIDVNIQTITKLSPCEYIASNNIGLYGTDNVHLYYFNNSVKKWYKTPILRVSPSITNPLYNTNNTYCTFKTT